MFDVTFSVSGVHTYVWLPPLVTFFLAYFGAMAGVTGAFLLLPFQMSFLGYVSPGVSATNFFYNLFAIPGTVFKFIRDGRMNWPLALVIAGGSFPGIILGYYLRVFYLTDPGRFKPFAGFVLLYLGWRLLKNLAGRNRAARPSDVPLDARIRVLNTTPTRITYSLGDHTCSFNPSVLFAVSLAVGVVGGAYGIGGGAILSPLCITVWHLPVYSVAGASLFGTFVSSVAGVAVYSLGLMSHGVDTRPDVLLGALFGAGGILGGYLGALTQRYVPEKPIKIGLLVVVLGVAFRYLAPLFSRFVF